MLLNRDETSIEILEEVSYNGTFTDGCTIGSIQWNAYLNGISESGEKIEMSRVGETPDKALKALFEAMTGADVTL